MERSLLFRMTALDAVDVVDTTWAGHAADLKALIGKAADVDIVPILVARSSVDEAGLKVVSRGLAYMALTDADNAPRFLRFLEHSVRDDMAVAVASVAGLVLDKWPRLLPGVRGQALWLLDAFVEARVSVWLMRVDDLLQRKFEIVVVVSG